MIRPMLRLLLPLAILLSSCGAESLIPSPEPVSTPPPRSVVADLGYSMVEIPAGSFQMGSDPSSSPRDPDETPHSVEISRPYLLGATEVSQQLWTEVMGRNPVPAGVRTWNGSNKKDRCASFGLGPELPVQCISWFDAVQFCNVLSQMEGLRPAYQLSGQAVAFDPAANGYRLPTEAEWEHAARAGTSLAYSGWDAPADACRHGNVSNRDRTDLYETKKPFPCDDGHSGPAPTGTFEANGWGLRDMTGNVWEWTWDVYGEYPVGPVTDPTGPVSGERRVIRGAAWHNTIADSRAANRFYGTPDSRSYWVGLRLARTPGAAGATKRPETAAIDGEALMASARQQQADGTATSRTFVSAEDGWWAHRGRPADDDLPAMTVLSDRVGRVLSVTETEGGCVDICSSTTYVFDPKRGRLVLYERTTSMVGDAVCGVEQLVEEVVVRYPRPGEESRSFQLRDPAGADLSGRPGCDMRAPDPRPAWLHVSQLPVLHLL